MSVTFSISRWSAWGAGVETCSESLKKPSEAANVKQLPMMLRRRLSGLGRRVMGVVHDLGDVHDLPMVFSSRYGESVQTVKLLQSLSYCEPLSPTIFSTSVHNGLAGLLSIILKNTQSHTAVSAGSASFCNGLLEACAMLHLNPDTPVLFVHYDEPLADFYDKRNGDTIQPVFVALVLQCDKKGQISCSTSKPDGKASQEDAALSFMDGFLKKKKNWFWHNGQTQWNFQYAE